MSESISLESKYAAALLKIAAAPGHYVGQYITTPTMSAMAIDLAIMETLYKARTHPHYQATDAECAKQLSVDREHAVVVRQYDDAARARPSFVPVLEEYFDIKELVDATQDLEAQKRIAEHSTAIARADAAVSAMRAAQAEQQVEQLLKRKEALESGLAARRQKRAKAAH
jgi:hypothetical protein